MVVGSTNNHGRKGKEEGKRDRALYFDFIVLSAPIFGKHDEKEVNGTLKKLEEGKEASRLEWRALRDGVIFL